MQTVKPRARKIRKGTPNELWIVHGIKVFRTGATLDEALQKWNDRVLQRITYDATRAQA